ncbi:MAG: hypothetical protein J6M14_01510 [Campylobacter sp.]|nr:hypothetical protein [Campylobacter sp.]
MAKVLSRVGLRVGLEDEAGTYKAPREVVKLNEVITPSVEFDSVDIPNFGYFGGMKEVVNIPCWGRITADIKTCFYDNLEFYHTLLTICNLKNETNAEGNTEFTPYTHSEATASLDLVLPDRLFKFKGSKANFKMSGKVADKIDLEFGVQGSYAGRDITESEIGNVEGGEVLVIDCIGAMSIDGVQINLSEFEFDMGCEIAQEKFTNVNEFHISDYAPKLTVKCRLEKGQDDGFDAFKNASTIAFEAIFRNKAGQDVWKLEIPKAQLSESPKFEDSEGIFVIERTFLAIADQGDDNFKLTYIAKANRD